MNALVNILGKQFKIKKGDILRLPYINDKKIGDKIVFDKVLFSDDGKKKEFGKPFVKNLKVEAKLLEHSGEPKITVFKFKRRKGYQKKSGHQQKISVVEILNFKKGTKPAPKKSSKTTEKDSKPTKISKPKTVGKSKKAQTKAGK